MTPRLNDTVGQCGCGRSPTGRCIGLHSLSEEQWEQWQLSNTGLAEGTDGDDELADYQKQAHDIWFKGGSCTGGKPE
jgi:hypothetical protein